MATAKTTPTKLDFREVRPNLKMAYDEKAGEVVIRFDPSANLGLSGSKKSNTVATTRGNMDLAEIGHDDLVGVKLGFNSYTPV